MLAAMALSCMSVQDLAEDASVVPSCKKSGQAGLRNLAHVTNMYQHRPPNVLAT